jgi:hypothetical protein
MPGIKQLLTKEEEKCAWAHAVIDALEMWSEQRYERFVQKRRPGKLDEKWFGWFIGSWSVARSIRKDCQSKVRKYLDTKLREALTRSNDASAIDTAARYIHARGWSKKENGNSSVPTSLVSKVGFFLCPNFIVPYDSLAIGAVRFFEGRKRKRALVGKYGEYHRSYESLLRERHHAIKQQLQKRWVLGLAAQLGCEKKWLRTGRFRRKLFDNYLVHVGRLLNSKRNARSLQSTG